MGHEPAAENSAGSSRLLYIMVGFAGAFLVALLAVALLATRPPDNEESASDPGRESVTPLPTRTPRPTGTRFPTTVPAILVLTPPPQATSTPTPAQAGPTVTPMPENPTPTVEFNPSTERNCDLNDGVVFEVEGESRGWIRNEAGQYAIYDIGLLTDEIIEAGWIEDAEFEPGEWRDRYRLYDEGSFEAYFEILDLDSHQFVIDTFQNGTISGRAVFWPRVQPGATLRITFATDAAPSTFEMQIDDDGDGQIDRTVEPDGAVTGRAACETVEPTIIAEVEEIEPGLARLTLRGEDNDGGSGVAAIEYYLFDEISEALEEPSEENFWPTRYSEPLLIEKGSLVLFHGWDNAGNLTFWEEIVVLGGFGPDVEKTITPGGPPVQFETPLPGQNVLLTFEGQAGQHIAAVISDNTYGQSPNHIAGYARIVDSNGEVIADSGSFGSLDEIVEATLETDGIYTLVIDPFATVTGSAVVTLYTPTPITDSITPSGQPVTVELDTPGQWAELTFEGTAGQRLALDAIATTLSSSGCSDGSDELFVTSSCNIRVELLSPDGEVVEYLPHVDERGDQSDILTLTQTGAYTVHVNPAALVLGTVDVRLLDYRTSATLTIEGPDITAVLERAGDVVTIGFSGEAGKIYLLGLADVSIGMDACCSTYVTVLTASGLEITDYELRSDNYRAEVWTTYLDGPNAGDWRDVYSMPAQVGTDGAGIVFSVPEDGEYTVVLDPQEDAVGSATVTLREVESARISATLDGPPAQVEIRYPLQTGIVEFDGRAGQVIAITASVDPEGESSSFFYSARLMLRGPDGDVLSDVGGYTGYSAILTQLIVEDGTYTLEISHSSGDTAAISVEFVAQ